MLFLCYRSAPINFQIKIQSLFVTSLNKTIFAAYPQIDMNNQNFINFFNLHWGNVYGLALSKCGNDVIAKDICQDIFLSIWKREMIFENDVEASKYLARSTKYQVLNYFRNKKHHEEITDVNFSDGVEALRYNPEAILLDKELSGELELFISNLEEPTKSIFLLSREQHLSYKEIASELGIAVKTVEKHISRVLKEFRAVLNPA